ncbi:MAG: hypothetical protein NTX99_08530 [Candidatus Aminicenantes bacterium]|nr:hypothetical protein [Candidatus Aminicenantes bacterium]
MRKSVVLVAAGLCLFGAAGLLASRSKAPAGGAFQDDRARFYGKQVVDHISVVDPGNALGEPDGRFAEIRPGGEMTVLMADRIYYSDASDDGAVVARGDGRYGLAGLFRMDEDGQSAWQPLPQGRTPGGFKLGTSMFNVVQSTDTLKIANDDTRSVFVDAVSGYGKGERAR